MNIIGFVQSWFTGRSPQWRNVRHHHLLRNPMCAATGVSNNLEVHHILPVHEYPELELSITNLITLTSNGPGKIDYHLLLGHCGNYRKWNPDVVKDAARMLEMFRKAEESRTSK